VAHAKKLAIVGVVLAALLVYTIVIQTYISNYPTAFVPEPYNSQDNVAYDPNTQSLIVSTSVRPNNDPTFNDQYYFMVYDAFGFAVGYDPTTDSYYNFTVTIQAGSDFEWQNTTNNGVNMTFSFHIWGLSLTYPGTNLAANPIVPFLRVPTLKVVTEPRQIYAEDVDGDGNVDYYVYVVPGDNNWYLLSLHRATAGTTSEYVGIIYKIDIYSPLGEAYGTKLLGPTTGANDADPATDPILLQNLTQVVNQLGQQIRVCSIGSTVLRDAVRAALGAVGAPSTGNCYTIGNNGLVSADGTTTVSLNAVSFEIPNKKLLTKTNPVTITYDPTFNNIIHIHSKVDKATGIQMVPWVGIRLGFDDVVWGTLIIQVSQVG